MEATQGRSEITIPTDFLFKLPTVIGIRYSIRILMYFQSPFLVLVTASFSINSGMRPLMNR